MRKGASLRSGALFLVFTDHLGHVVEGHALVTADGEVLVVMFPWGKQQQLTAAAGLHALTARFGQIGKTVFLKDDEGQAFVEGKAHDRFLSL